MKNELAEFLKIFTPEDLNDAEREVFNYLRNDHSLEDLFEQMKKKSENIITVDNSENTLYRFADGSCWADWVEGGFECSLTDGLDYDSLAFCEAEKEFIYLNQDKKYIELNKERY